MPGSRAAFACLIAVGMLVAAQPSRSSDAAFLPGAPTAVISDVPQRSAAETVSGGMWSLQGERLVYSATMNGDTAQIDLAEQGYGRGTNLAVDAYDDSVWITTDAALLLHFSTSGALLGGSSLDAAANALVVALDQTPWLLIGRELTHVSRMGDVLSRYAISALANDEPIGFAVDSLRGRIWIADAHALWLNRMQPDGSNTNAVTVIRKPRAIAFDARSGEVWVSTTDALLVVDQDGHLRMRLPEEARGSTGLDYDSGDNVAILRTPSGIRRISRDGRSTTEPVTRNGAIIATPAPLRIVPTLALIRPPAGAATHERAPELTLQLGAFCNTERCDIPRGYAEGIALIAAFDGATAAYGGFDVQTGQVAITPQVPLVPGTHVLAAHVSDRFGHDAALQATITILERTATGLTQMPESQHPDAKAPTPATKAANKAPAVTLTSPANGATFSAGGSITLVAAASDADGSIAKVEFYRNASTIVGTVTNPPYQFIWQSVAAGSYSVSAKAYDNRNGTATSAPSAITVVTNSLPSVALTLPRADAFYGEGSPIAIAATAGDSDGTVVSVEFFDGAVLIGAATAAPFAATWQGARAGNHTITARAVDDKGGVTISLPIEIVVGQPPVVVLKGPVACSTIDEAGGLLLAADAISTNGYVSRVEFFNDGIPVGVATVEPWFVTLSQPTAGVHSITARATDDRGLATTSRPAIVTIQAANQPPTVAITSPTEGSRFPLGGNVNLSATANDSDGVVTAVEYRMNSGSGAPIGRSTSPPFAVAWAAAAAGAYTLVAVAIDDRGALATSAAVHITVDPNVPPSVVLTSPIPNVTYTAPADLSLGASASDSDGSITKVDFFVDATHVASASTAPYGAVWAGVGAGNYVLTARATDNRGATSTSAPVAIVVANNSPPAVTLRSLSGEQYLAPATIAFTADASDADGTITSVEFRANGALLGISYASPYTFVWDRVPTGSYWITVTAVDNQGGTTTTAPTPVTVGGAIDINLPGGLDGSTIDDDNVLIRGTVSAPPNSAMTVNGGVTHIDDAGRFQANDVPLDPGANAVTVVVTTQDGQSSSRTITVNSTGRGLFVVRAAPTEGLNSLAVTFTVEDRADTPFERMTFDLDNDGSTNVAVTRDQFTNGTLSLSATYPTGTWLAVIKAYDDQERVIYSTTKSIVVLSPAALQAKLKGIYDGTMNRLKVGDVQGALTAFTGSARDRYSPVLTELGPALPSIIDQIGDLTEFNFGIDLAELSVIRATPDGPRRFMLYLLRSEDGIWRIDGM